jgi:hypothetical protein
VSSVDPVTELRALYARDRLTRAEVEAIASNLVVLLRRGDRELASDVVIALGRRHGAHVRDHVMDALDARVGPTRAAATAGKAWAERVAARLLDGAEHE